MLGIVLGDVSGKGVPAALQMARLISDFRYISQLDPAPEKVLAQINNTLCERSYRGMFTTAVFCLLDMKNRKLNIANGGHLSLILKSKNFVQEIGSASGTPLGILPNMKYNQEEHCLQSGDEILIFTDGVTEPKNKQQEEFGLDRLKNLFANHTGSPEEFLQNLKNTIKQFTEHAPQFDDLTALTFKTL
jgi:sigma-B regulation protein RsbU (phosphoserine phosphatase)